MWILEISSSVKSTLGSLDFGVGGNQFFAVTEGFEGAEREAVVNGYFEIYQDFGLLGGFDVVGETSNADEDFDVFRRIKTAEVFYIGIQTADIEVELPAQRFSRFAERGNNRGAFGYMPADEIEIVGRVFGQVDIVVEIEVGGRQEGMFRISHIVGIKNVNTVKPVGTIPNGGETVDAVPLVVDHIAMTGMAFNHIQKLRRVNIAADKQGIIRLAVRCQFIFDISDQLGGFKVFFGVFVPQHQLSEFDFQTTGKGRIAEIQVVHDDADDVEAVMI